MPRIRHCILRISLKRRIDHARPRQKKTRDERQEGDSKKRSESVMRGWRGIHYDVG